MKDNYLVVFRFIIGIRLIAAYAKQSNNIELTWGKELCLNVNGNVVKCPSSIVRFLARTCALPNFYGSSILERTEVFSIA